MPAAAALPERGQQHDPHQGSQEERGRDIGCVDAIEQKAGEQTASNQSNARDPHHARGGLWRDSAVRQEGTK